MADGTPAKAVLKRLINGGGKTSAIKLISAIFEPDQKRLDRGPRSSRSCSVPRWASSRPK